MPTRIVRASLSVIIGLSLATAACSKGSSSPTPSTSGASSTPSASGSAGASIGTAFNGNGISFDYPTSWQEFTLTGTTAQSGSSLWNETVGLDPLNFVSVAGYTVNVAITSDNIGDQKAGLAKQIRGLFAQAGGTMTGGPTEGTMAGFPSLEFTGTAKNPDGATVNSRLVLAFDGTNEYFVNCQYDDTGQTDVLAGCEQIVSTFAVG